MKQNRKNIWKAGVAIAVALAFVLPGSAAFANVGTIEGASNRENTVDINTIIDNNNGGNPGYTEDTLVAEKTGDPPMPLVSTIYVDDDYNETTPGWGIDHFGKIQDAINAAQPGDTIFVYNGMYPEQVIINKAVEVVGEDNINTLIMGPGTTPNVVSFYHTSDAQFHNFHIETDGAATDWRPIIFGELASHCSIWDINVGIDSPKRYGVELGFCDNMTFSNSTVHAYFRAFYILGTIDSLFSNLQVQSLNENGFDVIGATYIPTGDTRGAVRNTYSNIDITIGGDRGFQGAWLDNITIDHMTVTGGMSLSILAQNAPDAVITNSTGSGCRWGITFNDAPRGRIADCTYTNSGSSVGFGAWYGGNVVIERCIAENNGRIGLLIQEAPDSLMSQCTALNSSYEGIDITWAPNTIVSDCIVRNSPPLMNTQTSQEIAVTPPTINELIIPTSGSAHVVPMLSSEMLLTKTSADKAGPAQYTTTTKDTTMLAEKTTEQDASYTTVNVAEEYRDARGLSVGQSAKAEIRKITGVEKRIQDIYGIGLWETEGCFVLDCMITNMPIGINLIASPETTLHNDAIVNGIFYLTGEYAQLIDTTNTVDGKPLRWVDGASNQVFNNPDVGFLAIVNSDNITVQNYHRNDSGWGLLFYNTESSTIQNCGFSGNLCGLGLIDCSGITVQTTVLNNNNINLDIFGGHPELHTIPTTTTVNGNPVQYYKSLSHQTIDGSTLSIGYLGILSSNNVTVKNVVISQNGQGILVAYSSIVVSNCTLSNNDVGICIDHSTVSTGTRANTITENTHGFYIIDNSEIHGFAIDNNIQSNINVVGSNNEITGCDVSGADTGILMGLGASQNLIDHDSSTGASYAISLRGCDNNTLSFISTSYAGFVGVHFEGAADNVITNWQSSYDHRGSWGIGYRNTIENSVIANPTQHIMWQYYSKGYILHNITGYGVADSYGDGIMISASENFMVTDCTIHDAPTGIEISFLSGNNNTIMDCTISQVSDYALGMEVNIAWPYGAEHGLFAANNNTFINCNIVNNPGIGFLQHKFAQSATVDQCTFSNNGMGMWLQFVQNDVVKNTIISGNQYNFGMPGYKLAHFLTNDIQNTTFVGGKPVQIILGQSNLVLDNPDVGWLGVILCDNITLKNFNMQHNGQGVLFAFTTDSTISNCLFTQNRLSIELYGCQNCNIVNSTASDGAGGILIYDSRNNAISHCQASNNTAGGDPGIFLLNASYSMVTDTDCSQNTYPDPYLLLHNFAINGGSNSTITNITMFDTQMAVRLTTSNDNHFSHITVLRPYNEGFSFLDSSSNDISDSTVTKVQRTAGIYLQGSSYNHISNCIVRDSPGPAYYGIALTSSSNNNLVENCLVENASVSYGIAIFYSANNNRIRNCQSLHAPSGQGCYVREASGNTYENCTSSYNAQWGFRVRIATGNNIVNCTAAYNAVGIYVHETSHDNGFYYNNLFGNTQSQAYDNNVNIWDDGTHGNYYSDYNGSDADGDGVGDTPYAIPGGTNLDHYPKMMPYPNLPPVAAFTWTPFVPFINQTIQFDSSESSDPDGSLATWYWTFGDGSNSTQQNPTHAYAAAAIYTVSLTVTDRWSPPSSTTIQNQILVFQNIPPIADAGPDQTLNTPTVTFDGSGSYDPNGYIIAYQWDFGDGGTSYDMITTHTYSNDGTYLATLTVIDNDSLIGDDTATIIIDRVKPITFALPTGTIGQNGWYISPVSVLLIPVDNRSGVQETKYRLDGGTWNTYYSAPFVVSIDGVHTLEYYSTDKAGNVEDTKTTNLKIDQTAPEITLSINKTGMYEWIITAIVSDATSGIDRVEFFINNVSVYTDTAAPYEYTYSGPKNVTATAIVNDDAGLTATASGTVSVSISAAEINTPQSQQNTIPVYHQQSVIVNQRLQIR